MQPSYGATVEVIWGLVEILLAIVNKEQKLVWKYS